MSDMDTNPVKKRNIDEVAFSPTDNAETGDSYIQVSTAVDIRQILSQQLEPIQNDLSKIANDVSTNSKTLEKLAQITTQVTQLQQNYETLVTKVKNLEDNFELFRTKVLKDIEGIRVNVAQTDTSSNKLKEDALYQEWYSRRDNLKFTGIPEKAGENCEKMITIIYTNAGITVNPGTFLRIHRVGKFDKSRARPILARFHHFKDRSDLWGVRKQIREIEGVGITEDFPTEIAQRRRKLYPILNAAFHYRNSIDNAFRYKGSIVYDKLILNGKKYTVDTLNTLPEHLRPEMVATPRNDTAVVFYTKDSPLSNHYLVNFTVDNMHFNCMEQYIMQSKAMHFQDKNAATRIMNSAVPGEQKDIAKNISNYDHELWKKEIPAMLEKGLSAKFIQNDFLQRIS